MDAAKYSPHKALADSHVPFDAVEYFFVSPERFRQTIEPYRVWAIDVPPQQVQEDKQRLMPWDDPRWDAKADDVWAYACLVHFALTCYYPYDFENHVHPRSLLQAMKYEYFAESIQEEPTLQSDQTAFLNWIARKQNQRPTMEQVMNHSWLQSDNPTSPHNQDYLSKKTKHRLKTFRRVKDRIDDSLAKEMAKKGYSIQYVIGQGGFGAVYK